MAPLPDPLKLVDLTSADITDLINKDGKLIAPLLLATWGYKRLGKGAGPWVFANEPDSAARDALFAWADQVLDPRFEQYHDWAGGLAAENYATRRLAAVGDDGFVPSVVKRYMTTDSFVGYLIANVDQKSAVNLTEKQTARAGKSPAGLKPSEFHATARWNHVQQTTVDDVASWMRGMIQSGSELRVMEAFNATTTSNSLHDKRSLGWVRIAEPGACDFCLMLASRAAHGILYRSEQTANFRAHTPRKGHGGGVCRCEARPAWDVQGKVRRLSVTELSNVKGPLAAYAQDAAIFMDRGGAIGVLAA